jgi:hypothetical protein
MNISKQTNKRIQSSFYHCINLHDEWNCTNNGEHELKDCLRLTKQSRPYKIAQLMVCEHYLEGFNDALNSQGDDPSSRMRDVSELAGIDHGCQRAYMIGVKAGMNVKRTHLSHPTAIKNEVYVLILEAAWDEHRHNQAMDIEQCAP